MVQFLIGMLVGACATVFVLALMVVGGGEDGDVLGRDAVLPLFVKDGQHGVDHGLKAFVRVLRHHDAEWRWIRCSVRQRQRIFRAAAQRIGIPDRLVAKRADK